MQNSDEFKDALARTLDELVRLGASIESGAVADAIEASIIQAADRLGIQQSAAWRYFDAPDFAALLARQGEEREDIGVTAGPGQAPMPPVDNPEFAMIIASVPNQLAQSGGDLLGVITFVAASAWMAGHLHGEDGCAGCEGNRGSHGHDWDARMKHIEAVSPDVTQWLDRARWTAALHDSGYSVERR
ncbi:hypothetical protein ABT160_29985 [Streptomyces sp. NPDC001941]|uniref:hypothetical protein n=1 Tax=Streptomyces sp. NPDC001941 TaxID=3154659 RepID=UPI00331E37BC